MTGFLWEWDGWTTVAIAIGLVAVTLAFTTFGPFRSLERRARRPVPGTRPGPYSPVEVNSFLDALGRGARGSFRAALIADIPFAIAYGTGLVVLLDGTLGVASREAHRSFALLAIPMTAALADLTENVLLLSAIPAEAHRAPRRGLIRVANWFTWLKWLAVILTAVLILAGILALAIAGRGTWELHRLGVPLGATVAVVVLGVIFLGPLLDWELRRRGVTRLQRQVIGGSKNLQLLLVLGLVAVAAGMWPEVLYARGATSCAKYTAWSAGIALGAVLIVGLWTPPFLRRIRDPRTDWLKGRTLVLKLGLLLPFVVGLEEFAFRGYLFQLWSGEFGSVVAVTATAGAFGLWHVHSAGGRSREQPKGAGDKPDGTSVFATVVFTAAAGVLFGVLRATSECLWPPALLHWGANAAGIVLVVRNARRRAA